MEGEQSPVDGVQLPCAAAAVVGLEHPGLGSHRLERGLSNQLMQLERFLELTVGGSSVQSGRLQVAVSTIQFRTSQFSDVWLPFEALWDVTRWNAVAQLSSRLPLLTRANATCWRRMPLVGESTLLRSWRIGAPPSPAADTFLRALKPSRALEIAIAAHQPRSLGALHARIEEDLEQTPAQLRSRVGLGQLWRLIANPLRPAATSEVRISALYVATAVNEVRDPADAKMLSSRTSPWPAVALRFLEDADEWIEHPSEGRSCSDRDEVCRAVASLFLCRRARFFVGASISSFSWMVALLRRIDDASTSQNALWSYTFEPRLIAHQPLPGSARTAFDPRWTYWFNTSCGRGLCSGI